MLCGSERVEEKRENKQHANRHNHRQSFHGALLVFKLSAPCDVVTLRQFNLFVDALLHFCHETSHVTVLDENTDCHDTATEFAADVHASLSD